MVVRSLVSALRQGVHVGVALAVVSVALARPMAPLASARDLTPTPAPTSAPGRVTQSICGPAGTATLKAADGLQYFPGMEFSFNAPVAGKAILHWSADLSVPSGAEARFAWELDFGFSDGLPGNIASHQDYEETRTTMAVVPVTAGAHTLRVIWGAFSVDPNATVVANRRCAILEIPTAAELAPATVCSDFSACAIPISVASGNVPMPGLSMNLNVTAPAGGKAVVRLAADMQTSPGSEVRVSYKVDGAAPVEGGYGPSNLVNYQEFWEARSTIAVIPLSAGAHTILAYWRIIGALTDTAILQRGCLVIEPPTNAASATVTDCHTSLTGLVPADGQQPRPGLSALVVMPRAGNAIVHLAADMGVTSGAELRLAYSVNGGAAVEYAFGPGNIANSQDFWETRGAVAAIPLGAGAHTITPYWRVSDTPGNSGTFQRGCLTVSPTTLVGGPNFRITTPIQVAWDGGNAQTGYQLLKYNTSTAAAALLPLAGDAISYADLATVDGVVYCYVLAATGPIGMLGLSDLECALTGQQSGPNVPVSFTLDFNGPSSVLLTWFTPVGGLDSILVQRIPLDGSAPSSVSLPGGATASSQSLTASGTCFQLVGFKSITFSTTNVLCGVPGVGTQAATGKTAGEALAEVAERLQGLSLPEVSHLAPDGESAG